MNTIPTGSTARLVPGTHDAYDGKTCTIIASYKGNAGQGPVRYKVRWDDPADRGILHDDLDGQIVEPVTDPCDDGCDYDTENVCTRCGAQAGCDECSTDAVEQTYFEGHLCEDHLAQAYESLAADLRHDQDKEDRL